MILNGSKTSEFISQKLINEITILKNKGIEPQLKIIQVGNDYGSNKYTKIKINMAKKLGITPIYCKEESGNIERISELISESNKQLCPTIIQKPLPGFSKEDEDMVLEQLNPCLDMDCLSVKNLSKLIKNNSTILPCTPNGIVTLLKYYDIKLRGKTACIVGRSEIVGKPLSLMLLNEDMSVILCHSKTPIDELTRFINASDIIISATGCHGIITQDMITNSVKKKTIIDVGANMVDGKYCGDIHESLKQQFKNYTPVPNGVGPMTVISLMQNVINFYKSFK